MKELIMYVTLNSKEYCLTDGTTLLELLEMAAINYNQVAVAIGTTIIRQELFESTHLQEGDNVLVIGAAKGG